MRNLFLLASLGVLVCGAFASGRYLRQMAAGPIRQNALVTSLPEAGIGAGEGGRISQDDGSNPGETFQEVLRLVQEQYVDNLEDDSKMSYGAVRAMLLSLDDPKTRFLEPNQRAQLEQQLKGQFTGIGAVVTVVKQKKGEIDQRRLAVVAPAFGGPADKAGLRPGDIITEINGRWIIAYDPRLDLDKMQRGVADKEYRKAWKDATKRLTDGLSLTKALEQIAAGPGKALELTVERSGAAAPLKIKISTENVQSEPVEFKAINDRVAYLRITQFNDHATELFTAALKDAKQRAIVLDLRDNAGGPVSNTQSGVYGSALSLLRLLTPGGQVGMVVRKASKPEPIQVAASSGAPRKIAVLINGGTANVAELVASALKEKAKAILLGTRTFGDATMQKMIVMRNGAGMTLTAGKFLTAQSADFADKGIQPDIAIATGGPRVSGDIVVERAAGVLAGA